jgi:hypothetical protein
VALAEAELGELVRAADHLREVFEDSETPAALLDRVRTERAKVESKVARVTVDDEAARLIVDGREAEGRPPQMRVDPGEHDVQIVAMDHPPVDRTVTLGPGEHLRLAVAELTRAAPPAANDPKTGAAPPQHAARVDSTSRPEPEPRSHISPTWVFVGGALTAVLGGLTLWSALETKAAFSSFEEDVDDLTSVEARGRVDDGERLQTLTNGLLIATVAVGAATAAAFFLVDWEGEKRADRSSQRAALASAWRSGRRTSTASRGVALVVTPGTVTLTGRF